MAGGKETPRQKMIGMMYLVLTALLALQVSNAVLEKFAIINVTLEGVIEENKKKSGETLAKIVENAGKSDNPKITQAKEKAQKVRELTSNTLKAIDDIKVQMMKTSGTDKIDEKLVNDHSSKVASMMIQSPVGKKYQELLENFTNELGKITGEKYPTIAKAPKDFEIFKEDKDHANKDFITFTFENTPVIAALASVTEHQSQVLEQEALALEKLAADADAVNIKFDKYILMARAKSSVVAAGSKYEAEMFITGSSSAISPEMYKDGAKLPLIDAEGVKMGKVEFTASGGAYDKENKVRKTYHGKAILGDKVIEQDIEYFVVKPVIRVTTGNAPKLYMNCGNNVMIEVPTLGTNYNP
ncbi:MAG: gliding motility protein GldM, partial [Flammeovirgaceae bacterium]|nr:gliding motility protein GldM [Flammeovirgaceae bacterium]